MSQEQIVHTRVRVDDEVDLDAEMTVPAEPRLGVVLTHPHPLHGGSMHTPVPTALFERCVETGVAALRFDFRGVGSSTGAHDHGRGECDDVRAAIDRLGSAVEDRLGRRVPIALAGWSFGADVALSVDAGCDGSRVAGWFAVAAPLAVIEPASMIPARDGTRPCTLVVPEHDQFRPPIETTSLTEAWPRTSIEIVAGADHFLAGSLHVVSAAFERFIPACGER